MGQTGRGWDTKKNTKNARKPTLPNRNIKKHTKKVFLFAPLCVVPATMQFYLAQHPSHRKCPWKYSKPNGVSAT